ASLGSFLRRRNKRSPAGGNEQANWFGVGQGWEGGGVWSTPYDSRRIGVDAFVFDSASLGFSTAFAYRSSDLTEHWELLSRRRTACICFGSKRTLVARPEGSLCLAQPPTGRVRWHARCTLPRDANCYPPECTLDPRIDRLCFDRQIQRRRGGRRAGTKRSRECRASLEGRKGPARARSPGGA